MLFLEVPRLMMLHQELFFFFFYFKIPPPPFLPYRSFAYTLQLLVLCIYGIPECVNQCIFSSISVSCASFGFFCLFYPIPICLFCFILFYYYLIYNEREKGAVPDRRGGGEELRRWEGEEALIRIYYTRKSETEKICVVLCACTQGDKGCLFCVSQWFLVKTCSFQRQLACWLKDNPLHLFKKSPFF